MTERLTLKQKRFVEEYLVDLNATQAAIRAGYSAKTAYSIGEENLKKPEVQAAVDAANAARSEKALIAAEYVLRGLKEVVERCLTRQPIMKFDPETRSMKQKTEVVPCGCGDPNCKGQLVVGVWEFDSAGANQALALLGKHLKLFTDKIKLEGDEALAERLEKAIARVDSSRKGTSRA